MCCRGYNWKYSFMHPHLLKWWKDNPADPDRPTLDNLDVQRLVTEIDQQSHATDLGGTMSLNARLDSAGVVLRVHQPFVSRQRLLAVQQVRRKLADLGFVVPVALRWRDSTVFRCGRRWAELEGYIPHRRPKPTLDSYIWIFNALGILHRALATLDLTVPRPLIATYAPPSSLSRWLPVTEAAVQDDSEAADTARLLRDLIRRLHMQWVPASQLPQHLVHGDVRLSNVCQTLEGKTVYLDFGFLAYRPRLHDLAYTLAFMLLALHGQQAPETFAWQSVPRLIEEYEVAANSRLTVMERKAITAYTTAVFLYAAALAGFSSDPTTLLRGRLPFLHVSEWLLEHPDVMHL